MSKKRKHAAAQAGRHHHGSKKPRHQHPDAPRPAVKQHSSQSQLYQTKKKHQIKKKSAKSQPNPQHQQPIIPFSAEEHTILLVGEGDLSFAASLVEHHGCTSLRAGVLERNKDELLQKYPHAGKNLDVVEGGGGKVLFGLDVTKMAPFVAPRRRVKKNQNQNQSKEGERGPKHDTPIIQGSNDEVKKKGHEDDFDDTYNQDYSDYPNGPPKTHHKQRPIDTPKPPGTPLIDRILFNFPHVGGKSTDVNRQVRANQSLLVQFFERAIPSLAPGGRIVVTLFEGEPYSLWNVRDLGRHTGLVVERSFRFQTVAYPGYKHARTLGVVRRRRRKGVDGKTGRSETNRDVEDAEKDGDGESDDGNESGGDLDADNAHDNNEDEEKEEYENDEDEWEESTTAWRGEERPARSYVFVRKDDEMVAKTELCGGDKPQKEEDSSDDDSD